MDGNALPVSPDHLYKRLGTAHAPLLVDVRRREAFDADEFLIIGASRRSAFYHMLRGHVIKGLMKKLPHDCHLMICN